MARVYSSLNELVPRTASLSFISELTLHFALARASASSSSSRSSKTHEFDTDKTKLSPLLSRLCLLANISSSFAYFHLMPLFPSPSSNPSANFCVPFYLYLFSVPPTSFLLLGISPAFPHFRRSTGVSRSQFPLAFPKFLLPTKRFLLAWISGQILEGQERIEGYVRNEKSGSSKCKVEFRFLRHYYCLNIFW